MHRFDTESQRQASLMSAYGTKRVIGGKADMTRTGRYVR
jgi:hypothetical protein